MLADIWYCEDKSCFFDLAAPLFSSRSLQYLPMRIVSAAARRKPARLPRHRPTVVIIIKNKLPIAIRGAVLISILNSLAPKRGLRR